MNKKTKIIIGVGLGLLVIVGLFLVSPVWREKSLNEEIPGSLSINDSLEKMDTETVTKFNSEVEAMTDKTTTMSQSLPNNSTTVLSEAPFQERAHAVQGQALIIEASGKKYLRFENFHTVNGPDLRIYLSAGLDAADYIDLGAIKATDGNINYPLPANTNTSKYHNALVWCRAFNVLFSYAEL